MEDKSIQILLVEDSEVDAWLTQAALRESDVRATIHLVTEGNEALNFVAKIGPFKDVPTPDLILLDLKMAGMDGLDFLRIIKQHPQLRDIPVVILSTSSHPRDIEETYQFKAAAYLNKPLKAHTLVPIIHNLHLFRPTKDKPKRAANES